MYAGRVAWCPLVSHVEYAPRAMLRLVKSRDRPTDGRTDASTLHTARRGQRQKHEAAKHNLASAYLSHRLIEARK